MKYVLVFIIVIHALIHLMGFAKEWKLATISQMSGDTLVHLSDNAKRFAGVLWLIACVVFLIAAALLAMGQGSWWITGSIALVLSQALIVLYWQDAKAGTIANLIILVAVVMAYGQWSFKRMADSETQALLSSASSTKTVITEDMIAHLPSSVQRWLQTSGVVGKERVHTVRLKQKGKMRTAPSQPWMDVDAVQYFNADEPSFVWQVTTGMKGIPVNGRDKYMNGSGNMLITASGLIKIVDGKGKEIDQGSMLRYLGEMCWFPSAALSKYITWEAADSNSARATMNYKGLAVTGIFTFDELGRLISFEAKRFMGSGKDAVLEDWYVPSTEWRKFDGIAIPVKGSVIWKLKEGNFDYYQWEITDIEFNGNPN